MALTLNVHSSLSRGDSPASDDSSLPPNTPVSPSMQTVVLPASSDSSLNVSSVTSSFPHAAKRKPSRRANTAERRATHNAVERQRRETLNGRFLVRRRSLSPKYILGC